MNEKKRYYWIKLKTDFFNQETIDFLLSQKNGCEYIVLYQMLCLNTANTNGVMASKIGEMIVPYDINKIVRDTKYFDFDTVTVALELFKKLGLVYEEDDHVLKIANFAEMVGSEAANSNAQRQKRFRERHKNKELSVTNNNALNNDNNVMENNEEIEIDIRDRDKSIDIDIEKDIEIDNEVIISKRNDKLSNEQLKNEFESIWSKYPRKQGKNNAYKAFVKARKKNTSPELIMAGLMNYLNYLRIEKIDPQFIKQGSTWFNQECWNDDYTVKRNMTTGDIVEYMDFSKFRD